MKILHIIPSMSYGGAEKTLYKLINADKKNIHVLLTLKNIGELGLKLKKKGYLIFNLNADNFLKKFLILFYIILYIKKNKPDIVSTWLYSADLFGGIAARICKVKKIIWNIRNYKTEIKFIGIFNFFVVKICSILSNFIPYKITINSLASKDHHIKIGYKKNKFVLIYNGYENINNSKIDDINNIKSQFNITKSKFIMGMVSRIDKQKNQIGLIHALKMIENKIDFYLILCGFTSKNKIQIKYLIKKLNLESKVIIIDQTHNISNIYEILDLHILCSFSESFPNVVAESMLLSIPNIATNTGDIKNIINNFGWIAPLNNNKELSNIILESYCLYKNKPNEWNNLKKNCSKHIESNFNMKKMVNNFNLLWK